MKDYDELCSGCNGSGEGYAEGFKCSTCGGSGVEPRYDGDDYDCDPTPWCTGCGAMTSKRCDCGPNADND